MFGLVFCLESRSYVVQENTTDSMQPPRHQRAMDAKIEVPGKMRRMHACNTANP